MASQNGKKKILIVDDNEMNRIILTDMLEKNFELLEAENGEKAIEILSKQHDEIPLVLLDLVMPGLDGFAVLKEMNKNDWIRNTHVIIISVETAPVLMSRAFNLGSMDYITRPFDRVIVKRKISNAFKLFSKQMDLENLVKKQFETQEKNNDMMVNILSHIVEFRNGESGQHVLHINELTELFFEHLFRLTDRYDSCKKDLNIIRIASSLHDIGKIDIPGEVLNKPGRLTPEEFEIIKTHSATGFDILNNLPLYQDEPLIRYAREICRWHHERYDGRGYPDGLKGDEIPIAAQVVALADVYDALTSDRCYKKAFTHDEAVRMIKNGECGAFNPLLLQCLENADADLRRISSMKTGQEQKINSVVKELNRMEEST